MYRITGGRGSGKTYRLLEMANEHKGIVICSNPMAMRTKARSLGFTDIADFVSYRDSLNYHYERSSFIDELEKYAQEIFGTRNNLVAYTYTFEEENEN